MSALLGLASALFGLLALLGLIHPKLSLRLPFVKTRPQVFMLNFMLAVLCAVAAGNLAALQPPGPETVAERQARVEQLDAQARAIPASNVVTNLKAYQELLALVPANERYKEKVAHYAAKVAEQRDAQAKDRARIEAERREEQAKVRVENRRRQSKHGPAPENSAWDGSVSAVKDYVKAVAKDPDSVKYEAWGPVKYSDERGWVVQCDWRAKNSFGGYVRTVNTFYIRFGRVVDVE